MAAVFLQRRGHLERMRAAFHLAGAGEHRERGVIRHLEIADGDARIGLQGFVLGHGRLYITAARLEFNNPPLTQMAAPRRRGHPQKTVLRLSHAADEADEQQQHDRSDRSRDDLA